MDERTRTNRSRNHKHSFLVYKPLSNQLRPSSLQSDWHGIFKELRHFHVQCSISMYLPGVLLGRHILVYSSFRVAPKNLPFLKRLPDRRAETSVRILSSLKQYSHRAYLCSRNAEQIKNHLPIFARTQACSSSTNDAF